MSDLIGRQDAIDALEEHLDYLRMLDKNENPTAESKWYGVNWARNTIADLPSAEERPQGEWDYEQVAFYGVCSNCGVAVTSNLADIFLYEEIGKCPYNTNFCPNCGADMRGGSE